MTKREFANNLFNTNVAMIQEKGAKEFRKFVTNALETEFGVSHSAAAAMYNHAKKAALKAGLVEEFGRAYQAKPRKNKEPKVVEVQVKTVTVEPSIPGLLLGDKAKWQVKTKDGEVVGFFKSRAEARAAKTADTVVEAL